MTARHDTPRPSLEELLPILRAPETRERLRNRDGMLEAEGGERYLLVDDIPILLGADDGERIHVRTPESGGLSRLVRWMPSLSRNVAADENFEVLVSLLERRSSASGRDQLVLVVGGATEGVGLGILRARRSIVLIETNIALGPRTRIVCDVQRLPFADAAFDAVVCQAVLEYVPEPDRAVAEIHRVLARGGLVYSEIPFLQQAHGPVDFTRYTHVGHRWLYRCFDEVRSGAVGGPAMALAWAWRAFVVASAGRSTNAQRVASRIAAFTAFWLPSLDNVLARRSAGLDAAAGTFFLGSRRDDPVDEDVALAAYRGIQHTMWD